MKEIYHIEFLSNYQLSLNLVLSTDSCSIITSNEYPMDYYHDKKYRSGQRTLFRFYINRSICICFCRYRHDVCSIDLVAQRSIRSSSISNVSKSCSSCNNMKKREERYNGGRWWLWNWIDCRHCESPQVIDDDDQYKRKKKKKEEDRI